MRSYLTIILLFLLPLASCKKDYEVVENVQDYTKLEIGNYWVYEVTMFTSTRIDSTTVTRDSIIGGNRYLVLEGHNWIGDWEILNVIRDSSHYLVNELGEVLFSADNFTDIIHEHNVIGNSNDSIVSINYRMKKHTAGINVPAGEFYDVMNYQGELDVHIQSQGVPNPKYDNYYYSKGVGLVESVTNFAIGTDKIEKRLVRYHVK